MKRIALFALAALTLVTGACKKAPVDNSSKPSMSWEANPSFTMMEIGTKMDAKVVFTVPEGVSSFVIKVTELPIDLRGILNKEIDKAENKAKEGSPAVLDLMSDNKFKQAFPGFVSPSGLAGSKSVTLDFAKLLNKLTEDQLLDNDARFTFEISMVDDAENQLKQTCRFRWTSAPEVSIEPKSDNGYIVLYDEVDFKDYKVIVDAPGKVENIIITFGGSKADPEIISFIKGYTKGDAVIDFSKDLKVATVLQIVGSAEDFTDKTNVVLTIGNLLNNISFRQSSTGSYSTEMKIDVVDVLGKSTSFTRELRTEIK